jgi:hypothetical protein
LPEGEACEGFPVRLNIGDTEREIRRTGTDREGNTVTLLTGLAEPVEVTNLETRESVTIPARGARTLTTVSPDGTTTVEQTGNLLLILFSSDVGGPSTTLFTGRTVFTITREGVFEVVSASGRQTDICAELTP